MAAVFVDACIGELTKLKQKVRARKIDTQVGDEQVEATQKQSPSSSSLKSSSKAKDDGTLSETTICLLMDRFAPW